MTEQARPERRHPSRLAAFVFTAALAAAALAAVYWMTRPRSLWSAPQLLGAEINEPSGIVFHPIRKTLFVVGDEGDIAEMTTDGDIGQRSRLEDADLEGITVDPATGRLYVLVEGENDILEIDASRLEVLREFDIGERYEGQSLLPTGAPGLEGIAFVPDRKHPEGGRFYVVNRGPVSPDGRPKPGHSFLAELSVPLKTATEKSAEARIVGAAACPVADLSALEWHSALECLVAVSDRLNAWVELGPDGRVRRRLPLPGRQQEGVAFDHEGAVYIAQDSGGVLKIHSRRHVLERVLP